MSSQRGKGHLSIGQVGGLSKGSATQPHQEPDKSGNCQLQMRCVRCCFQQFRIRGTMGKLRWQPGNLSSRSLLLMKHAHLAQIKIISAAQQLLQTISNNPSSLPARVSRQRRGREFLGLRSIQVSMFKSIEDSGLVNDLNHTIITHYLRR